jgi:Ca2+-transporting ATPase
LVRTVFLPWLIRRCGDGSPHQLRDPLVLVLLAAAALTLITADWPDAAVIALVVTGNTVAGVVQEIRADAAITALAALATPAVRVVRDSTQMAVPAAEIVPGDRILLGEGDVVPADADLLEASAYSWTKPR